MMMMVNDDNDNNASSTSITDKLSQINVRLAALDKDVRELKAVFNTNGHISIIDNRVNERALSLILWAVIAVLYSV
jgi:hypothetical protein